MGAGDGEAPPDTLALKDALPLPLRAALPDRSGVRVGLPVEDARALREADARTVSVRVLRELAE